MIWMHMVRGADPFRVAGCDEWSKDRYARTLYANRKANAEEQIGRRWSVNGKTQPCSKQ
jgi:hypothetical protein